MRPADTLLAVLGISEVALALFKRSKAGDSAADAGSLRTLWIVILCSLGAAFAVASPSGVPFAMFVTGVVIFACGALLRWYSIGYLGRFFTVDVYVAPDQRVIDTGPYRFIRHPSYTGILLEFLGVGLSLGGLLPAIVVMIPTIIAFLIRIRIEEAALERAIGRNYTNYRTRTRKLIPFVY